MIKRRYLVIILVLGVLIALIWLFARRPQVKPVPPTPSPTSSATEAPKVNGRRVLNLPPGQEKAVLDNLRPANAVSEKWQESLRNVLKLQGGDSLRDITIQKIESLIWMNNGSALNVESVAITLRGDKGERTKFRALVDSQSGKIIQSWDQPVYDPVHSGNNNIQIKLDPRYHND